MLIQQNPDYEFAYIELAKLYRIIDWWVYE